MDALLFVAFTLAMSSGFMISRHVLPALGLPTIRNPIWRGLHDLTANLTLLLASLHVALNWDWVIGIIKRYVLKPILSLQRAQKSAVRIEKNPQ